MSTTKAYRRGFADRLRMAILKAGTNQNRLALAIGYTRAHIGAMAHGTALPSVEVVGAICRHLGVSADWLLGVDAVMT